MMVTSMESAKLPAMHEILKLCVPGPSDLGSTVKWLTHPRMVVRLYLHRQCASNRDVLNHTVTLPNGSDSLLMLRIFTGPGRDTRLADFF